MRNNLTRQKTVKDDKQDDKKDQELEEVKEEADLDSIFEMEDSDEDDKLFAGHDDSDDEPAGPNMTGNDLGKVK